jgi:hypothetical protein
MHGLLPIIRRKRVPLLVRDEPPVNAGSVEPIKANAETLKTETLKAEAEMVNEVAGEASATTGGAPVLPKTKSDEEATAIEESGPTVGN